MRMKMILQEDAMDCGPACLSMISSYYGKQFPLSFLRKISYLTKEGVSLMSINESAIQLGFQTDPGQLDLTYLVNHFDSPCVLHWHQNHFVVLERIIFKKGSEKLYFRIFDPAFGTITLNQSDFLDSWASEEGDTGIALFLKPGAHFYNTPEVKEHKVSFKYILRHISPHRKQFVVLFLLLLLGNLLTLGFPILTKLLIDEGVSEKDLGYISNILIAQLMLFLGMTTFDLFRNRILLFVGTRISISITSEFLGKILKLPIHFFDTKMVGDLHQRISDNNRIQEFLTTHSLTTTFSLLTFIVYFVVLGFFDPDIMLVYFALTACAVLWSFFWLKKRKKIDYRIFQISSKNLDSIYEIINGVSEMKLNNFENYKRKEWEKIQEELFEINVKRLNLDQFQLVGFDFFNQLKNIIVVFFAATLVSKGEMTLGTLLSISFIVGQMNSPISQLIDFIRSLQDANLSLARLTEIQNHPQEEKSDQIDISSSLLTHPTGIKISNLSFQYEGPNSPYVLHKVSFTIPEGKTTAIVGASGSGKTTLLKLLLKYYEPTAGEITYNNINILDLSAEKLRKNCGVVMQDGYIFSDTIYRNVVMGDESNDMEKFNNALRIANIDSFVYGLALEEKTKLGHSGNGISGGQQQRMLIARAVYKNAHYLFFDEATSALDAENEKVIHDNLQEFFKGKTVVIVAHRLSTVKNADQIIVMNQGEISEIGNHSSLVEKRGDYFNLVKNQLELGN